MPSLPLLRPQAQGKENKEMTIEQIRDEIIKTLDKETYTKEEVKKYLFDFYYSLPPII